MDKIDRLGWAAGISFTAYGSRIGIRVNEPDALDQLARRLPYGWKPATNPIVDRLYSLFVGTSGPASGIRRYHLLYRDLLRLARTHDYGQALDALEADLRLSVAEHARRHVFVHAGAVGWRGKAIVIPGRSLSGKTTLVAELMKAGATYYSDEYAVFDEKGLVLPFAKPLSIRLAGDGFRQTDHPAETLGGRAGMLPLPLGLVVETRYRAGSKWKPRDLSAGQGALALLANAVAGRGQPARVLKTLTQAAAGIQLLKGPRGEASTAAGEILAFCDSRWS